MEGLCLSEPLAASRRVCVKHMWSGARRADEEEEGEELPEHICRDEELIVVQVFSQLRQVVHVLQLLPKLVAEMKTNRKLEINK